jgi:hypothetical protein
VRVWTLDEATAALPEVRVLVHRVRELLEAARNTPGDKVSVSSNGHGPSVTGGSQELRDVLKELDDRGIIVRDPERGLIDFPAETAGGRTYLLCWLDGEDSIDWWHWPEDGFACRAPLTQPPA